MMAIRCLYKLLNVSLDNCVSFFSELSKSRRLFLRSMSVRSLASAVIDRSVTNFRSLRTGTPRFVSTSASDNRVSSSSALSDICL